MIKHNVKQFSEFQNWLDRPLNCFCERCRGIVRHHGAHYRLRNSGICLQQLQQSCSFIRIFFSCHLCSTHNFKLETVKSGSCGEVRGGERKREDSGRRETWASQRIRQDGKLSEKMWGEQKKPGSVISLDGWLTTKSYNRGKESAGKKEWREEKRQRMRWGKKNVKWNEQRGGGRGGMRKRGVMLKWVCCSETTVGCQLLKWEEHWVDSSVTSLTQSWQHQWSLAASKVIALLENMMENNVHIIKSKKVSKSSFTSDDCGVRTV